jgi:hypothetical protein
MGCTTTKSIEVVPSTSLQDVSGSLSKFVKHGYYKLLLLGTGEGGRTTLIRSLERFVSPRMINRGLRRYLFGLNSTNDSATMSDIGDRSASSRSDPRNYLIETIPHRVFQSALTSIKCLLEMTRDNGMYMATYVRHCRHSLHLPIPSSALSSSITKDCDPIWCCHCPPIGGWNSSGYSLDIKKRLDMASTIPELIDSAKQFQLDPSLQPFYDTIYQRANELQSLEVGGTGWNSSLAPQIME